MLPVNSDRHIAYQAFVLESVLNIILILLFLLRKHEISSNIFTILIYLIQITST